MSRVAITLFLATPIDASVYAVLKAKGKHRRPTVVRTWLEAGLNSRLGRNGIAPRFYTAALNAITDAPVEGAVIHLEEGVEDDAELYHAIIVDTEKKMRAFVVRALLIAGYLVLNPMEANTKLGHVNEHFDPLSQDTHEAEAANNNKIAQKSVAKDLDTKITPPSKQAVVSDKQFAGNLIAYEE